MATFDGDELDHDDAETEALVGAGLELHLSCNRITCDVEWVREGDRDLDLGVVWSSVHRLGP